MENYSLIYIFFFPFWNREVIYFFTLPFSYFGSSKYDEKHLVKLLLKQEASYSLLEHSLICPNLYLEKNIDWKKKRIFLQQQLKIFKKRIKKKKEGNNIQLFCKTSFILFSLSLLLLLLVMIFLTLLFIVFLEIYILDLNLFTLLSGCFNF